MSNDNSGQYSNVESTACLSEKNVKKAMAELDRLSGTPFEPDEDLSCSMNESKTFFEELKELMEKHGTESIRPIDMDAFISTTEPFFMNKMEVKGKKKVLFADAVTDDTEAMRELLK